MTDREMLELAAKAAGMTLGKHTQKDCAFTHGGAEWNPITDDGDAFRLAVHCAQQYGWKTFIRRWLVSMMTQGGSLSDHTFATRLAIVRAAAEIGRSMK